MGDIFFPVAGMILAGLGLLLLTEKVRTYITCTAPIHATVIKLNKEYTQYSASPGDRSHHQPASVMPSSRIRVSAPIVEMLVQMENKMNGWVLVLYEK